MMIRYRFRPSRLGLFSRNGTVNFGTPAPLPPPPLPPPPSPSPSPSPSPAPSPASANEPGFFDSLVSPATLLAPAVSLGAGIYRASQPEPTVYTNAAEVAPYGLSLLRFGGGVINDRGVGASGRLVTLGAETLLNWGANRLGRHIGEKYFAPKKGKDQAELPSSSIYQEPAPNNARLPMPHQQAAPGGALPPPIEVPALPPPFPPSRQQMPFQPQMQGAVRPGMFSRRMMNFASPANQTVYVRNGAISVPQQTANNLKIAGLVSPDTDIKSPTFGKDIMSVNTPEGVQRSLFSPELTDSMMVANTRRDSRRMKDAYWGGLEYDIRHYRDPRIIAATDPEHIKREAKALSLAEDAKHLGVSTGQLYWNPYYELKNWGWKTFTPEGRAKARLDKLRAENARDFGEIMQERREDLLDGRIGRATPWEKFGYAVSDAFGGVKDVGKGAVETLQGMFGGPSKGSTWAARNGAGIAAAGGLGLLGLMGLMLYKGRQQDNQARSGYGYGH